MLELLNSHPNRIRMCLGVTHDIFDKLVQEWGVVMASQSPRNYPLKNNLVYSYILVWLVHCLDMLERDSNTHQVQSQSQYSHLSVFPLISDAFLKMLQTSVDPLLQCAILHISSKIPNTEYTGLICDYQRPSLPLFWQLHWCSWWHTHLSLHGTWRSTPHVQLKRLPFTKLSVCLWPQLLLHLHTYGMGWLNCRCHTVEQCTYFGFADTTWKVSSSWCMVSRNGARQV